jgi:hypothetical protein
MGGFLIGIQPFLYYYCFVDKKNKYTNILAGIFLIYLLYIYIKSLDNLCSNRIDNRPRWSFMDNFDKYGFSKVYILAMLGSTFLITSKLKLIVALLYGLTFIISYINYNHLLAEFWCYFSNSIPIMILLIQKFLL